MNHPEPSHPRQQPCSHCGACARACPAHLQPQRLFAALAADDWAAVRRGGLAACIECDHCTGVCPSHIPLLDWFRWGKVMLRERNDADAAGARFAARNARLAREREARATRRTSKSRAITPAQTISKSEVLAAIARGKVKRVRSSLIAAPPNNPTSGPAKKP